MFVIGQIGHSAVWDFIQTLLDRVNFNADSFTYSRLTQRAHAFYVLTVEGSPKVLGELVQFLGKTVPRGFRFLLLCVEFTIVGLVHCLNCRHICQLLGHKIDDRTLDAVDVDRKRIGTGMRSSSSVSRW